MNDTSLNDAASIRYMKAEYVSPIKTFSEW